MKQADIQRLGKYEIVGELGKGAMGIVYKGFDPGIERYVAIKTVRKDQVPDDDEATAAAQIERFKREAKAAGRMVHPNIVAIYEYGEDGETAYIAMEFIEGKSLKDYFDDQERFDVKAIGRIMIEMLSALEYSHKSGIIHRDIKPANIMMTKAGEVKITDFGIARLESSSLTQAGTVLGTPSYMSPEQFMGQQVDARSDLFSAGGVLYQLLTGEKPFTGSLTTIMHKVLHATPERPSALNVQVPGVFDRVAAKAMAKRPDERFQSAAEFGEAVKAALEGRPLPGAADSGDDEATMIGGDATLMAGEATLVGAGAAAYATPPGAPRRGAAPAAVAPAGAAAKGGGGGVAAIAAGLVALAAVGGGAWWFLGRPQPTPVISSAALQPAEPRMAPVAPQPSAPMPVPQAPLSVAPPAAPVFPASQTPVASFPAPAPASPPTPVAAVAAPSLTALRQALGRLDCALLDLRSVPDGSIAISGSAGPRLTQAKIGQAIGAVAAGQTYTMTIDPVTEVMCNPLAASTDSRLANLDRSLPLQLRPANGTAVFHKGEDLVIEVELGGTAGGDAATYVQVDYFTLEGYVVHLWPNPLEADSRLTSGSRKRLGERAGGGRFWTVGEPFGKELLVAIASPVPLFVSGRPEFETVDAYLPDLRKALADIQRSSPTRPPLASGLFIKTLPQ